AQAICARSLHLMAQSRALAGAVAATEDTVALTYARLAERRPPRAERLRQLSQHARAEAGRLERGGTLVLLRPQRAVAKMLNLLGADQLIARHDGEGSA